MAGLIEGHIDRGWRDYGRGERRGVSTPVKAPYRRAYAAPLANLSPPILYTKGPGFHVVLGIYY